MPRSDPKPSGPTAGAEPLAGRRGFLGQSVASVAIKGSSLVLGFLTVLVLARLLGKDGYGVYAVVYATVSVLAIPAALGTPALVVRETARARTEDTEGGIRAFWAQADRFVLLASLTVLVLAGLWLLYSLPDPVWFWAFMAGLALIPLRAFIALRGAMLRGMGRVVPGQTPEFLWRPGIFLALIGAISFVAWAARPSAADALWAQALAAALALAIAMVMLGRVAPPRDARTNVMGMREMLVASGTMGLIAGAQVLNNNLDVMMLGALTERGDAGVYKVAASCALLAGFGLQAVNQALMPRVAANHKRGDRASMQALIRQSAQLSMLLAVAVAAVLALAGTWFIETAFGPGFGDGYTALLILLAGQVLNAAFGPVIAVLNMTGHERDTLRGVLIACALNVVLNAVLIPPYGIEGAAIATAVTLACWNALLFVKVRQRLGMNTSIFGRVRS